MIPRVGLGCPQPVLNESARAASTAPTAARADSSLSGHKCEYTLSVVVADGAGRFVRFTEAHVQAILEHLKRKPDADVLAAEDQEMDGWGRPATAVLRQQRRNARGER